MASFLQLWLKLPKASELPLSLPSGAAPNSALLSSPWQPPDLSQLFFWPTTLGSSHLTAFLPLWLLLKTSWDIWLNMAAMVWSRSPTFPALRSLSSLRRSTAAQSVSSLFRILTSSLAMPLWCWKSGLCASVCLLQGRKSKMQLLLACCLVQLFSNPLPLVLYLLQPTKRQPLCMVELTLHKLHNQNPLYYLPSLWARPWW